MKTAIVILGFNGPGGREEGNIVHIAELTDDAPVWFGSRIKPPRFHIVVLANTRIKDLPAGFADYGCHTSRKKLDYTRLANGMDVQLRTKAWVGMTPLAFRLACTDRGDYWMPDLPKADPGLIATGL